MLPPRPETTKSNEQHEETSSQGSSNDKRKKPRFKILAQLLRSDKKTVERKPQKSRCRSRSFLQKVLGKKKSFEAEDDIVYETVDYAAIEKQEQDGKSDAEMLTELQRILESRKKMLQNKFNVKEDKGARPISCMEDSALIKGRETLFLVKKFCQP